MKIVIVVFLFFAFFATSCSEIQENKQSGKSSHVLTASHITIGHSKMTDRRENDTEVFTYETSLLAMPIGNVTTHAIDRVKKGKSNACKQCHNVHTKTRVKFFFERYSSLQKSRVIDSVEVYGTNSCSNRDQYKGDQLKSCVKELDLLKKTANNPGDFRIKVQWNKNLFTEEVIEVLYLNKWILYNIDGKETFSKEGRKRYEKK